MFNNNDNQPVAAPHAATVVAGQTVDVNVQTESHVGLLSGNLTLNGSPANNLIVCVRSGFTGPNGDQWTPTALEQCGYVYSHSPYDGTFKFLVPPGSGTLSVRGTTGNQLHSQPYTIAAGEEPSVGTIAVELGDLVVRSTYGGADISTLYLTACSV